MYEAFFGLKRRPFAATPDPQCFLASGSIQAALDEIVVCVEQGQGIAVVTAPAGTGKTLLCERLRSELGERFESVLLRHASFLTRRALLQTILCELHHSYRQQDEQELRLELSPALRALRPQREALVLICDEAHQFSEELLEELRILSDLAEQGRPLVRLVLVGQLGLEETLALSSLAALSQRIRAHVCLETLTRAGSLDYIDYRLTWAGGRTDEIFTTEALEMIGRAADGVPRCINQLCDHALLLAYVAEQQPVPVEMIREALQDLRQLPLHWNESSFDQPTHHDADPMEAEPGVDDRSPVEASFVDRRSDEPDWQTELALPMESIEIGADLPPIAPTQMESTFELYSPPTKDAARIIDSPIESPVEDAACEVTDVAHEGVRGETMIATSSVWDIGTATSKMVPLAPINFTPINFTSANSAPVKSPSPGGFVEELVLDRYAAIDAGLEPSGLIASDTGPFQEVHFAATAELPTTAEPPTTTEPQATIDTVLFGNRVASGDETAAIGMSSLAEPNRGAESSTAAATAEAEAPAEEVTSSAPSDLRTDSDFEQVCERLNELLPRVADKVGWDSASLHSDSSSADAHDAPAVAEIDEAGGTIETHWMEDRLGGEVCQLADQLQQMLGRSPRENSPVEQLRSLLPPSDEEFTSRDFTAPHFSPGDSVEENVDSAMESISTSTLETSRTTIEPASSHRGTARPYRNLFSLLRRKQQGLL